MAPRAYVYILTNDSGTLYIGVTRNRHHRVKDHKGKLVPGFTAKYNLTRLVYFEEFDSIRLAISREKQLKGWRRARKIALIESANPEWKELAPAAEEDRDSSLRSE